MTAGRLILADDVLVLDVDAGVTDQVVEVDVYRVGERVGLATIDRCPAVGRFDVLELLTVGELDGPARADAPSRYAALPERLRP